MPEIHQGHAAVESPAVVGHALWPRLVAGARRTVWGRQAALQDYVRRVWDNSAEDNIFFLASGVAFNIILATIPFFLLVVSGLGYVLNMSPTTSLANVSSLLDRLMPPGQGASTARDLVHSLLLDLIRGRSRVGLYGAIGFIWFSTRLFGSLRSVLASVFDIDRDRGIIAGKWFDVRVTIIATVLVVGYTALSAYLAIATTRGAQLLSELGVEARTMGSLQYNAGRALAVLMVGLIFLCLYKYLPSRHIRLKKAMVSAGVAVVLFQLAKAAFRIYLRHFNPGSVYTGALAAGVIVFLWVYYLALVFVIGGEVGQVYELRRVRRLQQMDLI
jgi:membrane protein